MTIKGSALNLGARLMRSLGIYGFLLLSALQAAAVAGGLADWPAAPRWAAALVIGFSPLLGTVGAIVGAAQAWSWPWLFAAAVFVSFAAVSLALVFAPEYCRDRLIFTSRPSEPTGQRRRLI